MKIFRWMVVCPELPGDTMKKLRYFETRQLPHQFPLGEYKMEMLAAEQIAGAQREAIAIAKGWEITSVKLFGFAAASDPCTWETTGILPAYDGPIPKLLPFPLSHWFWNHFSAGIFLDQVLRGRCVDGAACEIKRRNDYNANIHAAIARLQSNTATIRLSLVYDNGAPETMADPDIMERWRKQWNKQQEQQQGMQNDPTAINFRQDHKPTTEPPESRQSK
jgi:hypothetical protein